MKIFFDTNVYVAEALIGESAQRIVEATIRARWRVYVNRHVLDELRDVLVRDFGFSERLATLSQRRIVRRSAFVEIASLSVAVLADPKDSPILQAALNSGADYLVTNDRHLLALHPFEGLKIISMTAYFDFLQTSGLLT